MFNNGNNKTLQSVIDAASKILMGVQDQSVADAQTEDQHPIAQARMAEAKMKMKMKEKMDPVGKEDDDVDNDGDSDDSDDYLKARRKAISIVPVDDLSSAIPQSAILFLLDVVSFYLLFKKTYFFFLRVCI